MKHPVLETHNVTIGYLARKQKKTVVAQDLSLALFPGEVVCLIGPNGAGKSTLLRTLSGIQPPLAGKVLLNRKEFSAMSPADLARNISIVLTEQVRVGMLSVFSLVALGRYPYTDWTGKLSPDDLEIIHWAIHAVGADTLSSRHVNELSDGERQKVMIARALAQQPHVIILDEPTAFLDLPRRVEMMSLLRQLSRDTGTAILLSTHDLELALRTADRLWLLPDRAPLQVGAPEDLVLSGALEQTFKNNGVVFDKWHGAFVMTQRLNEHVALFGEGFHAVWTRKALEREGFLVNKQAHDAPIHVHVDVQHDSSSWRVAIEDEVSTCLSIYDLIQTLRHRGAERRANKFF